MIDDIPHARLDVLRWLRARAVEHYHTDDIIVRVIIDDQFSTTLEISTPLKVYPFSIDDEDWLNPKVITDHITTELGIQL